MSLSRWAQLFVFAGCEILTDGDSQIQISKNGLQLQQHPRRPRGSQSSREKRWDESFQVLAEEPLGTDSHRNQMEILYQTESLLTARISLVHEPDKA